MWIARDKNGELWVYNNYPIKGEASFIDGKTNNDGAIQLHDEEFPEVTWENSPKEIRCLPSYTDELEAHFNTTSKEQLDKEFQEIEKYNEIVPIDPNARLMIAIEALSGLLASGNPDDGTYVNQAVCYADLLITKLNNETL